MRETLFLRFYGLLKIPLIFFCSPSVVELGEDRVEIRIPLKRRTKNHLGSMYFGALSVGADVAGGILAMRLIQKRKAPVSLVFKSFRAEFVKRAEGDVRFICEDGARIRELVDRAIHSDERQNMPVRITARVAETPDPGDPESDVVARFELELSLKRKSSAKPRASA